MLNPFKYSRIFIIYHLFRFHTAKNSLFSLALKPTDFIRPVLPRESRRSEWTGRWVILTRKECLMKLVARHKSVQGVGVGSVMSEGVYLRLQAYIVRDLVRSSVMAGENVRRARPFVGVV